MDGNVDKAPSPGEPIAPAIPASSSAQTPESSVVTAPISSAAAVAQSGDTPPAKPAYPSAAPVPTQEGPKGVRFERNRARASSAMSIPPMGRLC